MRLRLLIATGVLELLPHRSRIRLRRLIATIGVLELLPSLSNAFATPHCYLHSRAVAIAFECVCGSSLLSAFSSCCLAHVSLESFCGSSLLLSAFSSCCHRFECVCGSSLLSAFSSCCLAHESLESVCGSSLLLPAFSSCRHRSRICLRLPIAIGVLELLPSLRIRLRLLIAIGVLELSPSLSNAFAAPHCLSAFSSC